MKTTLYLLLMFLPLIQRHSIIDWKPDYRLVWDDFKAKADLNSPNAALTSTAIKFDFSYNNGDLKYHISCGFDKALSWGRVKNDYILSHEQGHFDIAEINARKFFKALKAYKPGEVHKINKELNEIYQHSMQELHDMQSEYDSETNFSINTEKQHEWLGKIKHDLKELDAYADYH